MMCPSLPFTLNKATARHAQSSCHRLRTVASGPLYTSPHCLPSMSISVRSAMGLACSFIVSFMFRYLPLASKNIPCIVNVSVFND